MECGREQWRKFRKYHYLNTDLADMCKCYGLYDGNKIIGFMGILHQPHPLNKKIKRVSRLVILPDYQGIGLGTKFLNKVAQMYANKGYDFCIVTSAKNLIYSLRKSDKWCMYRWSIVGNSGNGPIDSKIRHRDCYTGSFMYRKE